MNIKLKFRECESCAQKSGSPVLCAGCRNNRWVIEKLLANPPTK